MSIVFVSGFQRCGSSLVMQMLAAGGMHVVHDPHDGYPAYESSINTIGGPIAQFDGSAMKWLEPLRAMPAELPSEILTPIIWMARDYRQQALSAVKFMRMHMGMKIPQTAVRKFERSYARDNQPSIARWQRRGPVLVWRFGALLADPLGSAQAICRFIGRDLNIDAMVAQVRPRGADCLPYMLEDELISAGEPAKVTA